MSMAPMFALNTLTTDGAEAQTTVTSVFVLDTLSLYLERDILSVSQHGENSCCMVITPLFPFVSTPLSL